MSQTALHRVRPLDALDGMRERLPETQILRSEGDLYDSLLGKIALYNQGEQRGLDKTAQVMKSSQRKATETTQLPGSYPSGIPSRQRASCFSETKNQTSTKRHLPFWEGGALCFILYLLLVRPNI